MTETRDLASSSDDGDATSTGPLVHWSIPPHSSGVINHHPVSAKARRVESWLGACSLRCSDPLSLELGSVPMAKTILQCWEASIGCSWLFIEHIYIYPNLPMLMFNLDITTFTQKTSTLRNVDV